MLYNMACVHSKDELDVSKTPTNYNIVGYTAV